MLTAEQGRLPELSVCGDNITVRNEVFRASQNERLCGEFPECLSSFPLLVIPDNFAVRCCAASDVLYIYIVFAPRCAVSFVSRGGFKCRRSPVRVQRQTATSFGTMSFGCVSAERRAC